MARKYRIQLANGFLFVTKVMEGKYRIVGQDIAGDLSWAFGDVPESQVEFRLTDDDLWDCLGLVTAFECGGVFVRNTEIFAPSLKAVKRALANVSVYRYDPADI